MDQGAFHCVTKGIIHPDALLLYSQFPVVKRDYGYVGSFQIKNSRRRVFWRSSSLKKLSFEDFFQAEILLLVFSVTPFKIDQTKNQNRSIDKVQNLGK